ncbi:MAG TPA: acyl-CoA dehydrogenase family protein [Ramlibacter sp.]|nr:acyl-CoA dehydrogenase family protein [Ramlibacter sp.]
MALDALLDDDDLRFRDELRHFCAQALDPRTRARVRAGLPLAKSDYVGWQQALASRGWLTFTWPVADGGTGWNVVRQYLFEEELVAADCPQVGLTLAVGPRLVGPILCKWGTPAQKARFLPPIREARTWWCQGYSEPEAGSDLASLRTRARKVDGGWRVDGSKTWTSYAHWADWMACLARTDADAAPQRGVSVLAVDMRSPGVTVRPIVGANGRHFFNEVFLDDVFVPDDGVVGPVHGGWSLAKALLEHERLNAARVAEIRKKLQWIRGLLGPGAADGHAWRWAELEADHAALEALALEFVGRAAAGEAIGPAASMLKLRGTELLQQVMDLASDVLGPAVQVLEEDVLDAALDDPAQGARWTHAANAMYTRGFTIAAGTSEVQRNVIARQVLGLGA